MSAPVKREISKDVLDSIDVRVGTIRSVHDVDGADSLVRLQVSFGDHDRTILAALKREGDDPLEIEGKQALFVVNIEPRRMLGWISEGILLDIGDPDGIAPVLAVPESPVPDGVRAG